MARNAGVIHGQSETGTRPPSSAFGEAGSARQTRRDACRWRRPGAAHRRDVGRLVPTVHVTDWPAPRDGASDPGGPGHRREGPRLPRRCSRAGPWCAGSAAQGRRPHRAPRRPQGSCTAGRAGAQGREKPPGADAGPSSARLPREGHRAQAHNKACRAVDREPGEPCSASDLARPDHIDRAACPAESAAVDQASRAGAQPEWRRPARDAASPAPASRFGVRGCHLPRALHIEPSRRDQAKNGRTGARAGQGSVPRFSLPRGAGLHGSPSSCRGHGSALP